MCLQNNYTDACVRTRKKIFVFKSFLSNVLQILCIRGLKFEINLKLIMIGSHVTVDVTVDAKPLEGVR